MSDTKVAPAKKAPAKKEAAPKKERITQNGIVRPAAGTKTGKVWEIADKISQDSKAPATRADVLKECEAAGIVSATGATQYGRWCKFNNVAKAPKVKAEKPAKAAKAEKEVEEVEEVEEDEFDEE
jgi:hypothetical protein